MNVERSPISEPRGVLPPVLEPGFHEKAEFLPFKTSTRDYWLQVARGQCQWDYYEGDKLVTCRSKAKHVHHIIPEGWQLQHGDDPEHSIGLPLCENHHVRNTSGEMFEEGGSMHPDVSQDYRLYREWKRQQQHMNQISGKRRTLDYSTSPFAETAHQHHDMAVRGERYWSGDSFTDQYYIEKMTNMATTSGIRKPKTEPHLRYDPNKRKDWKDEVVGETFRPRWFKGRK